MKVSDTISFPTNSEMRLYTARLLRKSRREEIKMLSRQYELIADAIEGYRILFSIWLKRFFAGSMTVSACIVLFYQLNKSVPLESAAQASNPTRTFSYVPILRTIQSNIDYSKVIPKETRKFTQMAPAMSSEVTLKEMSFQYEPDTSKTLIFQEKQTEVFRTKYYMDLGFKIRFVEGYMLSDQNYNFHNNIDVPLLGGLPAEYENKKSKENEAEVAPHVFSYKRNVDQAIKIYASGDWIGAVTKLEGLIDKFPNDVNLNFYLGMSHYHLGEYEKALYHLGNSVTLENNLFDQEQDFYIAMSYMKNGQEDLALEYLDVIAHSNSFYSKRAKELLK
jgi:tetratricopeptide (TPR) repeat protein